MAANIFLFLGLWLGLFFLILGSSFKYIRTEELYNEGFKDALFVLYISFSIVALLFSGVYCLLGD